MKHNKAVLKVEDVAELLGESREAIRTRVYRGQIPARKLGRRIIFLKDEFENWLKKLPYAVPLKQTS